MSHATLTQRLAAVDHFTDEVLNAATVVLHHYTYGRYAAALRLPAHSYHRHDGALDRQAMSCGALAARCEALKPSSDGHLPTAAW